MLRREKRAKTKNEKSQPQLLDCRKKCPRGSRNSAHLSLLAIRFRSLTVKRREETEADPLPMAALDFAGLARSENNEGTTGRISRELCAGRYCFLYRSTFQKWMKLKILSLIRRDRRFTRDRILLLITRDRILFGSICLFTVIRCVQMMYLCFKRTVNLNYRSHDHADRFNEKKSVVLE